MDWWKYINKEWLYICGGKQYSGWYSRRQQNLLFNHKLNVKFQKGNSEWYILFEMAQLQEAATSISITTLRGHKNNIKEVDALMFQWAPQKNIESSELQI